MAVEEGSQFVNAPGSRTYRSVFCIMRNILYVAIEQDTYRAPGSEPEKNHFLIDKLCLSTFVV